MVHACGRKRFNSNCVVVYVSKGKWKVVHACGDMLLKRGGC
jgi:hypothetical protein